MLSVLDAESGITSLYVSTPYWNTKDPQRPTTGRVEVPRPVGGSLIVLAGASARDGHFSRSCSRGRVGGDPYRRFGQSLRTTGPDGSAMTPEAASTGLVME